MGPAGLDTGFVSFAAHLSKWAGSPLVFAAALTTILVWAACGPLFEYSEGWMLTINTGTTICTFLMVFVIQNSQNRDGLAVQIKLDEIIRSIHGAKNTMINLQDLSQEELEEIRVKFAEIGNKARKQPGKQSTARAAKARSAT